MISAQRPTALMVATTWWPSVALLGMALVDAGFAVTLLCPDGHLAALVSRLRCRRIDANDPLSSLETAAVECAPVIVVPADDRSVLYLQQWHRAVPSRRALIEASVGMPEFFETTISRVPFLALARSVGMATPENGVVQTMADLDRWMTAVPAPWVLKVDQSWGGEGVRVAATPRAARKDFLALRRGVPAWLSRKRALVNGDPFGVADRRAAQVPNVSAHAFVAGRAGHCVMFCRDGIILGSTVLDVERTCGARGPATLVRVVERPAFLETARRLIGCLGWSGFCCIDFIVDAATGDAVVIEFNPRITASCRIDTGLAADPIAAAAHAFGCPPDRRRSSRATRPVHALFPLAWQADPHDPILVACQDDVPWSEPALVEEALKPLWPERNALTRLTARGRDMLQFLRTGRLVPDVRHKPLAWWRKQGLLRGPRETEPAAYGEGATRYPGSTQRPASA